MLFRSPAHVTWLRALLESDNFKELLEAMASTGPAIETVDASVTPHFALIQLGKKIGYTQYPKRMFSILESQPTEEDLESNYQEP